MIQITKDTLRQLNAAMGKLDGDSGKVFVQFIGQRERDGLYHGELHYAEPGDDPPKGTVSIQSILSAGDVELADPEE